MCPSSPTSHKMAELLAVNYLAQTLVLPTVDSNHKVNALNTKAGNKTNTNTQNKYKQNKYQVLQGVNDFLPASSSINPVNSVLEHNTGLANNKAFDIHSEQPNIHKEASTSDAIVSAGVCDSQFDSGIDIRYDFQLRMKNKCVSSINEVTPVCASLDPIQIWFHPHGGNVSPPMRSHLSALHWSH